MKATGQLLFNREKDGTITPHWMGGRRIEVSTGLLEIWTGERPRVGQIVRFGDVTLRLVGMAYNPGASQDSFIAMREGPLARFVWRYWLWLSAHAFSLFTWECRWFRWREPIKGEVYPKRSMVGLLIRPLV